MTLPRDISPGVRALNPHLYFSTKCASEDPVLMTKRVKSYKKNNSGINAYSRAKHGWRIIAGERMFFRSSWEANYARYLEYLKENLKITNWEYEVHTFWFEKIKRGVRSYLPDFKITNLSGIHEWHEVKGWMDNKSKTKIKRMAKYYPCEKLIIIGEKWFRDNNLNLIAIIPDWERVKL